MYFRKKTLKKYALQEIYNNFKIKLKINFCESASWLDLSGLGALWYSKDGVRAFLE